MQAAAGRSLAAARMNQNVLALNRAEFRAALDPRAENRIEARKIVDDQLKQFIERFEHVAKTRDEQARNLLPAVKEALAEYQRGLESGFRTIEGIKDFQMAESALKLRDNAMTS